MATTLPGYAFKTSGRHIIPALWGLLPVLLWSLSGPAQTVPGYLTTEDGQFVRNNYGECWHTSQWRPELAVPECEGTPAVERVVPPVETPPVEPPQVMTLRLDGKAFFDFDRSLLKPAAREQLNGLIAALRGTGGVDRVLIVGHADRIGSDAYNQALSRRRALAVRDYLLQSDRVASEAITLEARGEREPLQACEGVRGSVLIRCLAPNRRVEITIEQQTP